MKQNRRQRVRPEDWIGGAGTWYGEWLGTLGCVDRTAGAAGTLLPAKNAVQSRRAKGLAVGAQGGNAEAEFNGIAAPGGAKIVHGPR